MGSRIFGSLLGGVSVLSCGSGPPVQAHTSDQRSYATIFSSSLRKAKAENKNLMVVVGAEWCGPCKELWASLHSAAFAPVMSGSYVLIDMDTYDDGSPRNVAGQELVDKWSKKSGGGIPLYFIFDGQGKMIADSFAIRFMRRMNMAGDGENLLTVLKKTAKHAKPEQFKAIQDWIDTPAM